MSVRALSALSSTLPLNQRSGRLVDAITACGVDGILARRAYSAGTNEKRTFFALTEEIRKKTNLFCLDALYITYACLCLSQRLFSRTGAKEVLTACDEERGNSEVREQLHRGRADDNEDWKLQSTELRTLSGK